MKLSHFATPSKNLDKCHKSSNIFAVLISNKQRRVCSVEIMLSFNIKNVHIAGYIILVSLILFRSEGVGTSTIYWWGGGGGPLVL